MLYVDKDLSKTKEYYTMRKFLLILITVFALGAMGACNWMGNTAGRAVGSAEKAVDNTKSGYEEGYERNRTTD